VKILFATSHFGFLRNFEPALRLLAKRGHVIHLTADRGESIGGTVTAEKLARDYPNITFSRAPNPKTRKWYELSMAIRLTLDYWRYLDPRFDSSPKLKTRAAHQASRVAVSIGNLPIIGHRHIRFLQGALKTIERSIPYSQSTKRFIETHNPDVLLITPLLYFGSSQVDYVRAARSLGIPSILCVGSWDHLTTKGLIHDVPDWVTVWNEAQRREARELHAVPDSRIVVTGAQAYDRWFNAEPSVSRNEFCNRVGFDPEFKIILYLCSSSFIAPHEVNFIRRWIKRIRSHQDPIFRKTNILVRPHPQNVLQWENINLASIKNVAVWPSSGANPIDEKSRADYFNSMYYSNAVVGVNTSGLIESGIVGRPVFTVLSEEFSGTQKGTLHFQHLTKSSRGLLRSSENLDEHLEHVCQALAKGLGPGAHVRNFLQDFIRPLGLAVPAAKVFADAIEKSHIVRHSKNYNGGGSALLRVLLYPLLVVTKVMSIRKKRNRQRNTQRSQRTSKQLRVLFVMASPEYLRFFDSTIKLLAKEGHKAIVAINHLKEKKPARLVELDEHISNIELAGRVPARGDYWEKIAKGLRGIVDFMRFIHPNFSNSQVLRIRMKNKVLPVAFRFLDKIPTIHPWLLKRALRLLSHFEKAIPSNYKIESFILRHDPDVLVVSPLIDAGSIQVDLVKSAKAVGVRTVAAIASWDNLTNKGLMRIEPDATIVWNNIQKAEAEEYHAIPSARIVVTGSPAFDKWFNRSPSCTREEFYERVGLPENKPYILFVGSSRFIAKSEAEVDFVKSWILALRSCPESDVRDLAVLVRPHPYNTAAWETTDCLDINHVTVWPRARYNPVDEGQRALYFDSLFYCKAVVGINTSAMIESAIIGRPVLSILSPEFNSTQEGTLHFRYLRQEDGGCVQIAHSFTQHIRQLKKMLNTPEVVREQTTNFVRAFVRPHGINIPCTPIVTQAIESVAKLGRAEPEQMSWLLAVPLRGVLVLAASFSGVVSILYDPRVWSTLKKRFRLWIHRVRKKIAKPARSFRMVREMVKSTKVFIRRVIVRPLRYFVKRIRQGPRRVIAKLKARMNGER